MRGARTEMIVMNGIPLVLLIGLIAWYGLAFIGIPGLVRAWRVSNGFGFFMALAVAAGLISAAETRNSDRTRRISYDHACIDCRAVRECVDWCNQTTQRKCDNAGTRR